jgi:outer membrane protein assembly factor BamB
MSFTGCWLQPGWGPHRTGHNPDETGLTVANVADLTEAWSVSLGANPVKDPAVSSRGVHAVSGRTVSTLGLDDGGLRWSADVFGPEYPDYFFHLGSPSVRGGQMLVPAYVERRSGSGGTGTYAFDVVTGEGGDRLGYGGSPDSVTVDGDTLATVHGEIWASDSQYVFSFVSVDDLDDPSQSWTTMVGNDESPSGPVVAGDRVIFSEAGSTVAFTRARPTECAGDPVVCAPVWRNGLGGYGTPVLSDDGQTVYVASYDTGEVGALDVDDGNVLWTTDVGAPLFAAVTVGNGWMYATSYDGRVYAIDLGACGNGTCPVAWAGTTGFRIVRQAALAGGVLYVAADDGTVHVFAATGCGSILCLPVWRTSTGSPITGGPTVALGRLLVGTEDGRLIAYRPA